MAVDTYAGRIIGKFGGISATATATGFSKSTVQRWKESGHIHPRHNDRIVAGALAHGVRLQSSDFQTIDSGHPTLTQISGLESPEAAA